MGTEWNEKWKELSNEIPVPDSLQPEQIEKKLEQTKQKRRIAGARRVTNRFVAITATAACALLLFVIGNTLHGNGILSLTSTISDCLESVGSDIASHPEQYVKMEHTTYAQLEETISDYYEQLRLTDETDDILYEEAAPAEAFSDAGAPVQNAAAENRGSSKKSKQADSYTKTDLQVQGVDEGDIVKTDGSYIYSCSPSAYGSIVNIYQASGKTTKKLSSFTVEEVSVSELYLDDKYLITVGCHWGALPSKSKKAYLRDEKTSIDIYDISDAANPVHSTERTQSGSYFTSRKNGHYLYTLSTMNVSASFEKDDKQSYIPSVDDDLVPEDRLYIPEHASSNSYLVLTALDVTNGKTFSDQMSVLGAGGTCYVSENNIYVGTHTFDSDFRKTTISKYSYHDGKLEAIADRIFDGTLHDQFSMDEYNGYLRFVATTYHKNGSSSNGLYVLDNALNPVGSVDKLARNERIYSARFLGDRAYFVTYRETDPVFLVDLTNPTEPVVKDELKIPGFSDYLHTFGDNLLLGIGSNISKNGTMQVKFSMFDISTDTAVTEIHNKLLEKDTQSIAGDNHKAVLVDTERNQIGLCIYSEQDDKKDQYNGEGYSYRIYSYDASGFHKTAKLMPEDLTQSARGLFIGDYFYLVDDEGIHSGIYVYETDTFQKIN